MTGNRPDIALVLRGFRPREDSRAIFSRAPHLTVAAAFDRASANLPPGAVVTFNRRADETAVWIHPAGAPAGDEDVPFLSVQFFEEFRSAVIRRIHAGDRKQSGIGTAMILSQWPFWQSMEIDSIAVQTHGMAEGFYSKLGFVRTDHLQEYADTRSLMTMMRLDLLDPAGRGVFDNALSRAVPLCAALKIAAPHAILRP